LLVSLFCLSFSGVTPTRNITGHVYSTLDVTSLKRA